MLRTGDKMADFEYAGADGTPRRLSDSWREGPAWLLWMRHCGCVFFAEAMAELAGSPPAGVARVCILQADGPETARWCASNAGCSTCVPDPKRETFAAIGLGHTTFGDILKPSESLKQRRNEAKSAGVKQNWLRTFALGNDVLQLPGAALVDRDGTIRYIHRGADTSDQLNSQQLASVAAQHL
jgi:hypothetical protein